MNLNAMFVSIFCVIGVFAVIFGFTPSGFFVNQDAYTAPTQQAKEVSTYFSSHNITLYNVSWTGNITYPQVIQNQTNLPDGHYIEIHWEPFNVPDGNGAPALQFRHVSPGSILWIIPTPWPDWEVMTVDGMSPYPAGSTIGETFFLQNNEDESARFSASCGHASISIVFLPINTSYPTLMQSWNIGALRYLVSYGIDFDAMKPGAWTLMSQLMTFQNPDFGVPGDGGSILNYVIAAGMWACIVLLIYAAVTSVIPTISGWTG